MVELLSIPLAKASLLENDTPAEEQKKSVQLKEKEAIEVQPRGLQSNFLMISFTKLNSQFGNDSLKAIHKLLALLKAEAKSQGLISLPSCLESLQIKDIDICTSGTTCTLKLRHSDHRVEEDLETFKSDTDIWN